jgi:hypothetical protein
MKLNNYYYTVLFGLLALAVWSCNKTGDDTPVAGSTSTLDVINAVTDIRAIDFYLNGTRQNNNSAIYLYNQSGYLTVGTGIQQYQFKNDSPRVVLADIQLNPAIAGASYTCVLAGQQSKNNLTPIFIADNFIIDTTNRARVRFVQASPGTAAYDVFVGDTLSFKNNAFKAYTGFQSVGGGKKTVKVNLAGTTTNIYTGTVTIQPYSYYTLLTEGVQGGTGNNAFTVSVNLSR